MQLRITPAVKWLLIACVGMFLVQQTGDRFLGTQVLNYLALVPAHFVIDLWLWQIATYSFLHGDVMHLFLNMLMLVFIGGEIESLWGTRRFLRFYFFCVVVGGLFYLAMQAVQGGLGAPMVGASGGIYGLLMAYGLLYSERVLLFMMLFPMKAKHFIWVLVGLEFLTSVYSPHGGLASVAHLGGMAGGFAYLWSAAYWKTRKRTQGAKASARQRPGHLRVVPRSKDADADDRSGPKTWH